MPLTKTTKLLATYQFIRMLTTDWEETSAYNLGLIDGKGRKIRTARTTEERNAYGVFERLVFSCKRIFEKAPGVKSRLGRYLSMLYLIREHTGFTEQQLIECFDINSKAIPNKKVLTEGKIGVFKLKHQIISPKTGDIIARPGTAVRLDPDAQHDRIFGVAVYEGLHLPTNQKIYITDYDIE